MRRSGHCDTARHGARTCEYYSEGSPDLHSSGGAYQLRGAAGGYGSSDRAILAGGANWLTIYLIRAWRSGSQSLAPNMLRALKPTRRSSMLTGNVMSLKTHGAES